MLRWLSVLMLFAAGCSSCGGPTPSDVGTDPDMPLADTGSADMPAEDLREDMAPAADIGMDAAAPDAGMDMDQADVGNPPSCEPVPGQACVAAAQCGNAAECNGTCDSRYLDCAVNDAPFDIVCATPAMDGSLTIGWDVSAAATSFVVTPFVADGLIVPSSVTRPDAGVTDLQTDFWWQSVMADNEGWFNPVTVPATADFLEHLQPGAWTMDLTTTASEVCWIVVEGEGGTRIEVDVYLVGVPDVTAASAPTDANLQAALEHAKSIYAGAGFELDFVRYIDPSPDDVMLYRILPDQLAAREMFTIAEPAAPTEAAVLRVPLFLVETLMQGRGFSPGIPAPPGLIRTRANGVVVSTPLLGEMPMGNFDPRVQDGNLVTGTFIAHEMAHYLGLQHTTEISGTVWDPLDDTPECGPTLDLNCPDVNNLMFPFAADNHTLLTADQTAVLGFSPLAR